MRRFEKEKKFPGYVIAGFYVLIGTLICFTLFLLGSSLAKNPVAAGSLFPASASAKGEEESFPVTEGPDAAEDSVQEPEEAPAQEPEPVYYSFVTLNTKGSLHVRVHPGMDAEIISRLSPGTTGFVLERGDEWSLIQTSDVTGYVSNQYLQFQEITKEEYLPEAADASQ